MLCHDLADMSKDFRAPLAWLCSSRNQHGMASKCKRRSANMQPSIPACLIQVLHRPGIRLAGMPGQSSQQLRHATVANLVVRQVDLLGGLLVSAHSVTSTQRQRGSPGLAGFRLLPEPRSQR